MTLAYYQIRPFAINYESEVFYSTGPWSAQKWHLFVPFFNLLDQFKVSVETNRRGTWVQCYKTFLFVIYRFS
jgi:hypothetical protein